ncbi:hypothetical protein BZA77DRAFT_245548 [Pyronema omphalodes]|nr:hypothetical protein BZA77DRAFT_245548 [Pyronema omphalodes]
MSEPPSSPAQEIPLSPRRNGSVSHQHLEAFDGSNGGLATSPTRMTTGKSGRVIEKLMAENDRLRRELKVETTAREEERKAKEAIRQARDSLQSTNANLILQNNIDKGSLARKDRKIEELKAERDFEREQRLEVDIRAKMLLKEGDDQVQELKNMLNREKEQRLLAVNQYDTVREGFQRLSDSYKQRVERLRAQLEALGSEREKDHAFLMRLEVTVEQQRQELEKLRLAKNKITERCESTINEAQSEMRRIRRTAELQEKKLDETVEAAEETVKSMRHLIGIEKAFRPE